MIHFILALVSALAVSAVQLEPAKGKTEFLAVGRPSAIKINGKGKGPAGDLKIKKEGADYIMNGEAAMDLTSLETGIGMRDRHMKETYLETEKFKEARLIFKNAKFAQKLVKEGGTAKVGATLDLHGKQQPVEVEVALNNVGSDVNAVSKFKVKLSDFAIAVPKYAGITVADEVQITTETKMVAKSIGEGT